MRNWAGRLPRYSRFAHNHEHRLPLNRSARDFAMGKDEEEMRGEIEERLVNEEYKIWKKNAPFLYNLVISTVEWLPNRDEPPGNDNSVQKMIQQMSHDGTYVKRGRKWGDLIREHS